MGDSMLLLAHLLMMAMFQVIMGILILGSEIGCIRKYSVVRGFPNDSEMTKYIQNQIPAPIKMVKFRINRDKT